MKRTGKLIVARQSILFGDYSWKVKYFNETKFLIQSGIIIGYDKNIRYCHSQIQAFGNSADNYLRHWPVAVAVDMFGFRGGRIHQSGILE